MGGPAIRQATSRIRSALDRAARAADSLAQAAEESAAGFDQTISEARSVVKDVEAASAEMRDAFGLGISNEEPAVIPLPSSPLAAPRLPAASSASTSAKTEVTALGPVSRVP